MPNIVLTRIDNRLVHGQVATQWCGAIGANLILVANDEVAGNSLRQGLMNIVRFLYHISIYILELYVPIHACDIKLRIVTKKCVPSPHLLILHALKYVTVLIRRFQLSE